MTNGPDALPVGASRRRVGSAGARGGGLVLAATAAQSVVAIGTTAMLARLLTPADFGLFAMAATVTGFVDKVRDFGTSAAVVSRADASEAQLSGLFWQTAWRAAALALLVAAIGPVAAWFYGRREVAGLLGVLAFGVAWAAVGQTHLGLLRRRMRFGAAAGVETAAFVSAAALAVALARPLGVWALAVQAVAIDAARTIGYWVVSGWCPGWRSSASSDDPVVRKMVTFGAHVSGARVIAWFGRNLDYVLLGRFVGAAPLGLYQKAFQYADLAYGQVNSVALSVGVPMLSRLRDDPTRFRDRARVVLMVLFGVALPMTAWVGVAAGDVVAVLLGPNWTDAEPLLRVLAIGSFFHGASASTKIVFLAEGRSKRQLNWALYSAPIFAAAVAVGVWWGAAGVAAAYAATGVALAPFAVAYCLRGSRLRWSDYAASWGRAATAAAFGAAAVTIGRAGGFGDSWHPAARLASDVPILVVATAAAGLLTPGGGREVRRIVQAVRARA